MPGGAGTYCTLPYTRTSRGVAEVLNGRCQPVPTLISNSAEQRRTGSTTVLLKRCRRQGLSLPRPQDLITVVSLSSSSALSCYACQELETAPLLSPGLRRDRYRARPCQQKGTVEIEPLPVH
jgi:hypothetical protein